LVNTLNAASVDSFILSPFEIAVRRGWRRTYQPKSSSRSLRDYFAVLDLRGGSKGSAQSGQNFRKRWVRICGTRTPDWRRIVALWLEWWRAARTTAAVQVSLILRGWGIAQYPYVIPFTLTIRDAAALRPTLELLLGCLGVGSLIVFPSLAYLFRTFSSSTSLQTV
jgi:hypothetical protein